jgi:hypothetical protein
MKPGEHKTVQARILEYAEALAELLREVEGNETRKKEQAEKSFDGLPILSTAACWTRRFRTLSRSAGRFATPSPSFRTGSAAKTPSVNSARK